jgi:hypothetical protein
MSDHIDDRVAAAIAHDSLIARAVDRLASTMARAWTTSACRRYCRPAYAAFCALSPADRLRHGLVVVGAAVLTRLLLLLL